MSEKCLHLCRPGHPSGTRSGRWEPLPRLSDPATVPPQATGTGLRAPRELMEGPQCRYLSVRQKHTTHTNTAEAPPSYRVLESAERRKSEFVTLHSRYDWFNSRRNTGELFGKSSRNCSTHPRESLPLSSRSVAGFTVGLGVAPSGESAGGARAYQGDREISP